jgi:glycerol-3-phosphate dehydrogenase
VKYTTGRLAAEEAVNLVERRIGRRPERCTTATTPLPGASHDVVALRREAAQKHGEQLPEDIIDHLIPTYGTGYERVLVCREDTPGWNQRVHDGSPVILAELVHGIRDEMAQSADDLLWRRTELGARGVSDDAVLARIAACAGQEWRRRGVVPTRS